MRVSALIVKMRVLTQAVTEPSALWCPSHIELSYSRRLNLCESGVRVVFLRA
jgi:hypothetical protein